MKILLVEDDLEISEMLKSFLSSEGFEVISAFDGEKACKKFEEIKFDIVLLDLMIPKISGLEVLKYIRQKSTIPVIIISAKDSDSDIVLGLGLGADDYIIKPFSITQVVARIKSNLRRVNEFTDTNEETEKNILLHGELMINLDKYLVKKNNQVLELTAKEFGILNLLMENPNRVYTKEQIYNIIWKEIYMDDENAVNVHISRLRNKIEDNPKKPRYIVTVWGIGYKLGEINGQ